MSSLPYSFFVGYTSTQLKVASSISRLNAIVITKPNQRLNKFVSVSSSSELISKYGVDSSEKTYADKFFEFQNKNGNFAEIITFYNLYEAEQSATLRGAKVGNINTLNKQGSFYVNFNGTKKLINVDLSNDISYTDIASNIQKEIQKQGEAIIYTSLDISEAENTELEITKGNDGEATQDLDIVTNGNISFSSENDTIATIEKSTDNENKLIIKAKGAGDTKIKIIASAQGKNKVEIVANVNVASETQAADTTTTKKAKAADATQDVLKITTTLENLKVVDYLLNITTNATTYDVENTNNDVATFDKATNVLKPLKEGETTFTIKATKLDSVNRNVKVIVNANLVPTFEIQDYIKKDDIPTNLAFANATFTFNSSSGGFELQCGISGEGQFVDYITKGNDNDLSEALCMRDVDGALLLDGSKAETLESALNNIIDSNGNYYSIAINYDLNESELKKFASIITQTQGRYLGIISKFDKRFVSEINPLKDLVGYDGLIVNYNPTNDIDLNPLTQAFIASLDLTQTNSVINMNFVSATKYDSQNTIYATSEMNNLNKNRVNGIFAVGDFGERKVYYGEGEIFGDKFTSANSYIWNSFIKFNVEKAMFFQLANTTHVGARNERDIKLLVDIATNECENFARAGIFATNATLTEAENIVLKRALNGDSNDYNSAIANGYVLKFVRNVSNDITNKITSEFSLVYIENKAINRVKIASVFI